MPNPELSNPDGVPSRQRGRSRKSRRWTRWTLLCLVMIAVAQVALFTFVLDVYTMEGASMSPTLDPGNRIFVNTKASADVGDVIIVAVTFGPDGRSIVKRVVGAAGDDVSYVDCVLTRNGQPVDEPYLGAESRVKGRCGQGFGPRSIPNGTVFVLGDNRGGSQDSRTLGSLPVDDIVGVAINVD